MVSPLILLRKGCYIFSQWRIWTVDGFSSDVLLRGFNNGKIPHYSWIWEFVGVVVVYTIVSIIPSLEKVIDATSYLNKYFCKMIFPIQFSLAVVSKTSGFVRRREDTQNHSQSKSFFPSWRYLCLKKTHVWHLQRGPLRVISGVVTPLTRVIASVTHLYRHL